MLNGIVPNVVTLETLVFLPKGTVKNKTSNRQTIRAGGMGSYIYRC